MELLRLSLRQSPWHLSAALGGNLLAGITFAIFAALVDGGLQRQQAGLAATIGFALFCCLNFAIRMVGSGATLKLCQGALESLKIEISERIFATDQDALASYLRVRQLARSLSNEECEHAFVERCARQVGIGLESVTYSHQGLGAFALGPIDFSINGGEIVFITGRNGSGKTTLALLILGLLKPASGIVRLNGAVVEHHDRPLYRAHFSVVFSDYHLFDDLVGPSGQPVTAEEANDYFVRRQIAEKVSVTERSTLYNRSFVRTKTADSTRRACLENRPFLLLDEWAADRAPIFKDIFYTQILQELKASGKGLIVISHDQDYFHCADRVVSLDDGRLKTINASRMVPTHEIDNAR
ncbi:ATP-binding cassette domain-containing protein [Rhizobium leguminosarum]|nr:ATP-binding cassette domain-containing protein [Rhizobium leguminosarum]TBF86455.1 ATP-binding cassette domain-containing protein [Rhizobium leguminosarum]TBG06915.1 ATP-binding cassette domain-containing protein [Rhizobium leguminosarum]TBG07315.1 ATP-binding cassette domain-containing protein [Rhizobium leguminosarum]TBG29612.1 ATP-binding cassette domain-containing protein [Rhizobium leguminosarum]TBG49685.1 ATP-binding cassette domain-containing protein [Rhizobium leguminosarum]